MNNAERVKGTGGGGVSPQVYVGTGELLVAGTGGTTGGDAELH